MSTYAIILAAGSGSRMEMAENKVFFPLGGIPGIVRSIAPFSAICKGIVLVVRPQEKQKMENILRGFGLLNLIYAFVPGGDTRQESVANGLKALPQDANTVLVHDGARPLVTEVVIGRVMASIKAHGSGIAAIPVNDTIKQANEHGRVLGTPDRTQLYAMQTPQGFTVDMLRQAHLQAEVDGFITTDDAALVEHAGMEVYLCPGDPENIKLTTPIDIDLAEVILAQRVEREA